MTWRNGRALASYNNGSYNSTYTYDTNGMRSAQSVYYASLGLTWNFNYEYDGTKLIHKSGSNFDCWFDYDESGSPVAMALKVGSTTTNYYYIKNLQGDVIALAKEDGTIYARYSYDAWGNIISIKNVNGISLTELSMSDPAIANPFRYRSYFYDDYAKLYQLQSRYYDPATGRFVNADGNVSTGQGVLSTNMFTYCGNNPIVRIDPTGEFWGALLAIVEVAIIIVVAVIALTLINQVVSQPEVKQGLTDAYNEIAGTIQNGVEGIKTKISSRSSSKSKSKAKVEEKEKEKDITITQPKKTPVVFPANPAEFNPIGLVPTPRAGTSNGPLISWMDPITNTEVFRWDANTTMPNGPHYHIYGTGHYYAGMPVPEPYASLYFPGG